MIFWPVPDPVLPAGMDPVLAEVTRAAAAAFRHARERFDRAELAEKTQIASNGTIATRLDILVEALVAEGSTDAFADVGGDRHRLVDLAPRLGLTPAAG